LPPPVPENVRWITEPSPVVGSPEDLEEIAEPVDGTSRQGAPEPAVVPYVSAPATTSPQQSRLERTIGLKWAGWVGAVVLVVGAALGVKFAYDQGWLGQVPPIVRLSMIVA